MTEDTPKQPIGTIREQKGYICSDGFETLSELAAVRHEITVVLGESCAQKVFDNAKLMQVLLARLNEPRFQNT